MAGKLIFLAPLIPAFVIAVVACLPWAPPSRPLWLLACLGYILLDDAVTLAGFHLVAGLHWNWIGKTFSIALAGLMILILKPSRRDLPLGLPAGRSGWRLAVLGIVAACLFSGVINFILRDHAVPSLETLAFESTMPGIAEELCWRGLVFVLLGRAYARPDGTPNLAPAAVCATLMFGLIHGFNIDNGSFRFAWLPFAYATTFGAGLAILRLKVKSLPSLIAVHNASNVFGELVGALP